MLHIVIGLIIGIAIMNWTLWRIEQDDDALPGDAILIPVVAFHLWLWARTHAAIGAKASAFQLDELRLQLQEIWSEQR